MSQMKSGIYKSTKGNTIVVAEDGRNLWALYNDDKFGKRENWPKNCNSYQEFVNSQKLVRQGDWDGIFF